jgi:hypothetical protein
MGTQCGDEHERGSMEYNGNDEPAEPDGGQRLHDERGQQDARDAADREPKRRAGAVALRADEGDRREAACEFGSSVWLARGRSTARCTTRRRARLPSRACVCLSSRQPAKAPEVERVDGKAGRARGDQICDQLGGGTGERQPKMLVTDRI